MVNFKNILETDIIRHISSATKLLTQKASLYHLVPLIFILLYNFNFFGHILSIFIIENILLIIFIKYFCYSYKVKDSTPSFKMDY